MFLLFTISIIILLLFIIFLLVRYINKFSFIKSINNKYLRLLTSLIPIFLIIIIFNYVNALVIIIHLLFFFQITSLINYFIKKVRKIDINYNMTGIIAITITILYLAIASYNAYHIKETVYTIETDKISNDLKILVISDSHIGTTFNGETFYNKMKEMKNIKPDLVFIVGDFVDDDTKSIDMIKSIEGLGELNPTYQTYFVLGNHDEGYFNTRDFTLNDLENELLKENIKVLKDEVIYLNDELYIIGRLDKRYRERKSIDELTKDLDKDKYIIDLNHQPNDYENEKNKVDLVISGHTHGGQLFPLGYISLLIKANDEFYGLHKKDATNFLVTSGISDWAIDFKSFTSSEYVIINLKHK